MDKKYITYEQLMAATIINYSPNVSNERFIDIVKNFHIIFKNEYEIVNAGINKIESFIEYNKKGFRLKKGFKFNTRIGNLFNENINTTLYEYLLNISGELSFRYIDLYKNKGCKECLKPCDKKTMIDDKYDENGLPFGHSCTDWDNKFSRQKVLR